MSLNARILNEEELIESRAKILKNAEETFNSFLEKSNEKHKEDNLSFYRKTESHNVVSILGGRGTGKTSIAFTLLNKLYNKKGEGDNENRDRYKIFPIIDPDRFDGENDALGWIIFSFEDEVYNIYKKEVFCEKTDENIKLKKKYEDLKEMYINSKKDHVEKISRTSSSSYELKKSIEDIVFANIKLEKKFKDFIRLFSKLYFNEDKGVLIFIFDDLDLSQEYGVDILKTINHYLKDQRIVSLVLGEEKVFKESCFLNSLKTDGINLDLDKNLLEEKSLREIRIARAEEFVEKILPKAYRFELKELTLEEKNNFKIKNDKFEEKDIKTLEEHMSKAYNFKGSFLIEGGKKTELNYVFSKFTQLPIFDLTAIFAEIDETTFRYDGSEEVIAKIKGFENKKIYMPMGAALPETPRKLSNLYMNCMIKEEFEKEKEKEKENQNATYSNRLKFNKKMFEELKSYFEALNFFENKVFNDIFTIDDINETITFNFSNYKLQTQDIQEHYWKKELFEIRILNKQTEKLVNKQTSRIIKFAYDFCTTFAKTRFIKIKDIDFSEIKIYEFKKLEIRLDDVIKTFADYYTFKHLYEIYEPLIIKDMKDLGDQLSRLRSFIYMFIKFEGNEKVELLPLKSISEIKKVDLRSELSDIRFDELQEEILNQEIIAGSLSLSLKEIIGIPTSNIEGFIRGISEVSEVSEVKEIKRKREEVMNVSEMAEFHNVPIDNIFGVMKKMGIQKRSPISALNSKEKDQITRYINLKE